MIARTLLLATALIAASSATAIAQTQETFASRNVIAAPVLRADVQVSGDLVRIGDVIDNAGSAGLIAIYRAPDPGATGSLPVAQVLNTLRAHQVIGVDTRGLKEISVTRLARSLEGKDIELQVARERRQVGLGEDDRAGLDGAFDDVGIAVGNMRRERRVSGRRANAGRLERILDGDRQPVERSPRLAARECFVGLPGALAGALEVERDDGVEGLVESRDARRIRVEQFEGTDLAAADRCSEIGRRRCRDVDRHR